MLLDRPSMAVVNAGIVFSGLTRRCKNLQAVAIRYEQQPGPRKRSSQ